MYVYKLQHRIQIFRVCLCVCACILCLQNIFITLASAIHHSLTVIITFSFHTAEHKYNQKPKYDVIVTLQFVLIFVCSNFLLKTQI